MSTERLEAAFNIVYVVAYVAATAGVLMVMFPGLRYQLQRAGRQQAYAWRLGRRSRPPSWAWAQLGRADLPLERAG